MMWQIIVYALGISAALSLAGFCEEKLSAMLGWSRRFFWVVTMVLSVIWPLGMMLWARPEVATARIAAQAVADPPVTMSGAPFTPQFPVVDQPLGMQSHATNVVRTQAPTPKPDPGNGRWNLQLPGDRTLLMAWAAVSAALILGLVCTNLFLHYRARRWRRETVLGRHVRVSELTGPALLGAWRPQIVVPRWFLDESAAAQALILEHEQQHIAARDPLLLRLALCIVAGVPWNLPLWWQLRRLHQAIELDCDARVLRSGAEAGSYGEVLLAVTQRASSVPAGVIAMGEPTSALERRIRQLTAGPARYTAPRTLAAVVFWGVGIGVAFALQAPALPRSAAKIAVPDDVPVSPPQSAQALPLFAAAQSPPASASAAVPLIEAPAPVGNDDLRARARAGVAAQSGRVEIAERRFGDVRFVMGAGQAMQWLEMYSDGNLIAAFRDFVADDVIASPDRAHFLALSNTSKSAYAFALLDRKGRIEASSPHGGELHYCNRTAWGIGEWFDTKKPGATFSVEKNELTSPATEFLFATVRGCDGSTVALTRAPGPARIAAAAVGLGNPAVSAPDADGISDRAAFFIGNTIANLRGLDPTFGDRTLTLVDGRRSTNSPSMRGLSLPVNWTDVPVFERLSCSSINKCSDSGDLLVARADGATQLLATGLAGDYIALPGSHRIFACADKQVSTSVPTTPAIVDLNGTTTMLPAHPGPLRICARTGSGDEVLLVYTIAQAGKAYTLARVFDASGALLVEGTYEKAGVVQFSVAGNAYSETVPGL